MVLGAPYFVRSVIHHKIDHKFHPTLLQFRQKSIDILKRAVDRIDSFVIGYIISHVLLRTLEYCDRLEYDGCKISKTIITWRYPYEIDAQVLEVVELRGDTLDVPPAVAIGVRE